MCFGSTCAVPLHQVGMGVVGLFSLHSFIKPLKVCGVCIYILIIGTVMLFWNCLCYFLKLVDMVSIY
jgi:hypothetical protein